MDVCPRETEQMVRLIFPAVRTICIGHLNVKLRMNSSDKDMTQSLRSLRSLKSARDHPVVANACWI